MNVRDLLSLPELRQSTLEALASEAALDRFVTGIHVAELPLVTSTLDPGEILFLPRSGLPTDRSSTRTLLADLSSRKIAALLVKTEAESLVSEQLTDLAELSDLAVITIDSASRFTDLITVIQASLSDEEAEAKRFGEDVRRRFTDRLVAGADIREILTETADMIGVSIFLEKSGTGLLLEVGGSIDDALTRAAWYAFERGLPSAPEAETAEIPGPRRPWGRLVAFHSPGQVLRQTKIVLEQVSGLIGLAVMHNREDGRLIARDRYAFLAEMMNGISSESRMAKRASRYGWKENRQILPISVVIGTGERSDPEEYAHVWADLETVLASNRIQVISGSDPTGRHLLLLIALREPDHREWAADLIAEETERLVIRHLGSDAHAKVCVGASSPDFTAAADGLRRVHESVQIKDRTQESAPPSGWFDVSDHGLDQLVWSLRSSPELIQFSKNRLGPLVEHDENGRLDLLATLTAFCDSAGQKSAAARILCIERQSLYHRLTKIESILKVDLRDGRILTELSLAVEVKRVLGAT